MKYLITKSLLLCFALVMFSCQNSGEISASQAEGIIEDFLEENPYFETGTINTNKMKLSFAKDSLLVNQIAKLENEGFLELSDEKKRKKLLAKDSIWIFTPILSSKALPYVVEQGKNSTSVKTLTYELDDSREIIFDSKTANSATCSAILQKVKTPFFFFGKDKAKTSFITQKFKLKYKEESGWVVVKFFN